MKRILLGMMALGMMAPAAMAADPVFPETFNVTANSPQVVIDQYYDDDIEATTIEVTGTTDKETVTLSFDLPEGWDGVFCNVMSIAAAKQRVEESQWVPLTYLTGELSGENEDIQLGKDLTFKADGMAYFGQCMLYAGDEADVANRFLIMVNVSYAEAPAPADPVFPESFNVTANGDGIVIEQYIDEDWDDMYTIQVTGETTEDNVILNFDIPEGWDGIIGSVLMRGGFKQMAPAEWTTMEDFMAEHAGADIQKGSTLEFIADGETSVGMFYLYAGDRVDMGNPILFGVMVDHVEAPAPADPVFPESFNVTSSSAQAVIDQFMDEDTDMYTIQVTGSSFEDTLTLTFELPEGWDGIIGSVMMRGGFKQMAPADWATMSDFEEEHAGMTIQKGTSLEFIADGETSVGLFYLYADDRIDIGNPIQIGVMVDHNTTAVETVEAENGAVRYFNLQGQEIASPKGGIFVKVSGDKAEKVYVK